MKLRRHEPGYSLVEVMIAVGITGVILLAAARFMSGFTEETVHQQIVQARDGLALRIQATAASVNQMLQNMQQAANRALLDCLAGATSCRASLPCPFPVTSGSTQCRYPYTLYDPPFPSTNVLTGPFNQPTYYNRRGGLCPNLTAASTECPFEVSTSFSIICRPGPSGPAADCLNVAAETVRVDYTVKVADGVALPGSRQLVPKSGYAIFDGCDLLSRINLPCPSPQQQATYTATPPPPGGGRWSCVPHPSGFPAIGVPCGFTYSPFLPPTCPTAGQQCSIDTPWGTTRDCTCT
jgi:prepilin-type N-terminal cleavage/methylation domain-containing protein